MLSQAELRQKYNITPDHSRGQNFLTDKNILKKIVTAADLQPKETVIEIGAGTGVLTEELAKKVGRVIAFEVDKKLAPLLKEKFINQKNVEIINEDILSYKLQVAGYKLVANIPYNITSAILEKFLSAEHKPSLMVFLVQREVAERATAKAGEMSFLSVMVQYYGQPKAVARVPAGAFWPKPKVESAILKISVYPHCHSD
ncbi:MAG: 16S rRNA (adenine(1518)-N(6)/adenine(1519)-N(6))-dimethyltransferase RsmA, partial [Patescibacteria group bacterium]